MYLGSSVVILEMLSRNLSYTLTPLSISLAYIRSSPAQSAVLIIRLRYDTRLHHSWRPLSVQAQLRLVIGGVMHRQRQLITHTKHLRSVGITHCVVTRLLLLLLLLLLCISAHEGATTRSRYAIT